MGDDNNDHCISAIELIARKIAIMPKATLYFMKKYMLKAAEKLETEARLFDFEL